MDKRAWIIFTVAVVAIFAGLIAFSKQGSVDVSKYNNAEPITAKEKPVNTIADHVFGQNNSKVVLIEYGDFQCPGCGNLHKVIEPTLNLYKDKITFVFRNFPISQLHPNARAAASAAEAAGLQGKYWEMNNKLYSTQLEWENLSAADRTAKFTEFAKEFNLKIDQFSKDLDSEKVTNKINFDQTLGKAHDVNATPTLFLNGKKLDTSAYESSVALRNTLDKAIADAAKSDEATKQ